MNCPACNRVLEKMKVSDLEVDVCRGGCGGIWFDNFELQKVDEQHETAGETLLNIERDPMVRVDYSDRRNCPKCKDMIMMRHFGSVHRRVEMDECPACGGVWLDCGELAEFRAQYATNEAREAAAAQYFQDVFGKQIDEMKKADEEEMDRYRLFSSTLRFICPSYYFPGK